MTSNDPFSAITTLASEGADCIYYRLGALEDAGLGDLSRLPYSIRVLLESALRNLDGYIVHEADVRALANWSPDSASNVEIPFLPGRVVLQDFTGVPCVVDLAAMRHAMAELGGDPKKINPLVQCDLVIDHSVQVDYFGSEAALEKNLAREFERNQERYEFLKWGQKSFTNFRAVPPGMGIVHQVNLEYLAQGVLEKSIDGKRVLFPDSLVGTDSHTTMINGLGVVGWGVGGIEAEAVMLGQPIYMLMPEVVGFELCNALPKGATATDLVLRVVEMLREKGVVGKFVEFYGDGIASMSLADRATIANMAPEYGATMGFFPVDEETCGYLTRTGRDPKLVDRVRSYAKAQGLFHDSSSPTPSYSDHMSLDMLTVEPSLAGPKRPQDRVALSAMRHEFEETLRKPVDQRGFALSGEQLERTVAVMPTATSKDTGTDPEPLRHGSVVIAAITSCTNTSNPSVMLGAGLLAKNAVARGLQVKPWVKTSLAPGSRVVTDYLEAAGVDEALDALGFQTVGYGCTTCIGNSGPLPVEVSVAIRQGDLVAASVLSGNRNFEGRVNQDVKANYLASPPLVVAFAIAGRVDIDLDREPVGIDANGKPVMLAEIWPSSEDVQRSMAQSMSPDSYRAQYSKVDEGPEQWQSIAAVSTDLFQFTPKSTYIRLPPFFNGMSKSPGKITSIDNARCLAMVGDSTTTDHISPAGAIQADGPAGQYLQSNGVDPKDFNSYGSRRGNDEVMTRGTFANIRLRNQLAPGTEGGVTRHLPTNTEMSIFDAAQKYQADATPLVVLGGKEYGTGSSRDWAAKGTLLLGVRAVLVESFERIHRSNLVGMGVLPLQFASGENRETLGLNGEESFSFAIDDSLKPGQSVKVTAQPSDGTAAIVFEATCRIDTPVEVDYYRNGGILQTVLRKLL